MIETSPLTGTGTVDIEVIHASTIQPVHETLDSASKNANRSGDHLRKIAFFVPLLEPCHQQPQYPWTGITPISDVDHTTGLDIVEVLKNAMDHRLRREIHPYPGDHNEQTRDSSASQGT